MSWHVLKDCESLPCLQGQEEVSSEAICWDGEQFVPSSGPTTLGGYCLPDNETESCLDSRSGMTCRPSMDIHGEGESMSSQADSPARTSAQPAKVQESTAQGPECGSTWPGSFARYDPNSSSWRTPQCSLLEGLDVFSETWPRWGMMRNGACSELSTLAPRTDEIESGLLPTSLASIATHGWPNQRDSSGRPGLQMAAMMWQTPVADDSVSRERGKFNSRGEPKLLAQVKIASPTVNDAKNSTLPPSQIGRASLVGDVMRMATPQARDFRTGQRSRWEDPRRSQNLNDQIGGQLNPPWVEWLMGWPIEWTDLRPLGMDKCPSAQPSHGAFCPKDWLDMNRKALVTLLRRFPI